MSTDVSDILRRISEIWNNNAIAIGKYIGRDKNGFEMWLLLLKIQTEMFL